MTTNNRHDEPLTERWLRCLGFRETKPKGSGLCVFNGDRWMRIELVADGESTHARTLISDGDVAEYIPAGLCPKTKADVLRLCMAFHFPFNYPTDMIKDIE